MASILESTASGAASGAVIGGGYGALAGGVIGLGAGLLGASAAKKAANAKANALSAQANRRLTKGKQEAMGIKTQGQLNQTSFAADYLSRGGSREILAQDMGMDEIADRATYEANLAMEDAQYEAQMIREDASAIRTNAKNEQRASILEAGLGGLSTYAEYKKATR
jgi:hypothetical protein